MTCRFCGGRNSEDDTRCRRCGREPGDKLTAEAAMVRTDGALAAMAAVHAQPAARVQAGPVGLAGLRPGTRTPRPVQGSLFWEKPAAKVIPFDSFQTPGSGGSTRTRTKSPSKSRGSRRYVNEAQGELDFLPAEPPKPRKLGTTVEAVIFSDDPVATRLHRAIAASIDWALVVIAYGMFLLVYSLCGGQILFDRQSLLLIGGVLPLLAGCYGIVWGLAGYESPGMRWASLRLNTFDGFYPERSQRLLRFLGSCLSLCTGVGLLWTFADEESLTWPDHISGTYPTPRKVESQVFRRH